MEFKASLDTPTKVITIFTLALVGAALTSSVVSIMNRDTSIKSAVGMTLIVLFVVAVLFLTFLISPQKYELTQNELIIKRPLSNVVIKIVDIASVGVIPNGEATFSLRTFGSGGFFGYFGRFYNSKFGNYSAYATRRSNRLLITTGEGRKIIITPDDLNMVSHLEERMG
ncbi:MAG: hypothetical protein JWO06_224 [Bacteroidota bacterium]|nr:hypothetical protein [Bacteroidota bacterium]